MFRDLCKYGMGRRARMGSPSGLHAVPFAVVGLDESVWVYKSWKNGRKSACGSSTAFLIERTF